MIPLFHGLALSIILFALGIIGIIIRRNLFFILISIEIITNAMSLFFILVGNYFRHSFGQIMYMFIITATAVEVSVSLSLLLQLYKFHKTLNVDCLSEIKK
ncbi:NADH-quinone oxidoreductase subunit K [Buchnera aphidicola (Nipponaphis monzeni)]|uniref:NADH-quinone oxidoreductase subunit K n=1 Tax=Buchnera aphidicola (Nipponaphis monzeni) TaxID=2495405 RepID=A0A455T9Y4_9GAMM|nr:NADH-quinone oxidoreductase subunit NuoK [Buchnera aphidicola]BBI01146.1 NADH-quinone oxidoreductase subunit K [Buchnera aphidicola (Nipponaphis monzeni)]